MGPQQFGHVKSLVILNFVVIAVIGQYASQCIVVT